MFVFVFVYLYLCLILCVFVVSVYLPGCLHPPNSFWVRRRCSPSRVWVSDAGHPLLLPLVSDTADHILLFQWVFVFVFLCLCFCVCLMHPALLLVLDWCWLHPDFSQPSASEKRDSYGFTLFICFSEAGEKRQTLYWPAPYCCISNVSTGMDLSGVLPPSQL